MAKRKTFSKVKAVKALSREKIIPLPVTRKVPNKKRNWMLQTRKEWMEEQNGE
jgi:hypothetical protein